jgi:hypothetical protein
MILCPGTCGTVSRSCFLSSLRLVLLLFLSIGTPGCITALGDIFAEPLHPDSGTWEGVLEPIPVVDHDGNTYSAVQMRIKDGQLEGKPSHMGFMTYYGYGYPAEPSGRPVVSVLVVSKEGETLNAAECPLIGKNVRVVGKVGSFDNPLFPGVGKPIHRDSEASVIGSKDGHAVVYFVGQEGQIIYTSMAADP